MRWLTQKTYPSYWLIVFYFNESRLNMNRKRKNENSDDSEIFEDLKNEKIIKVETEEEIEVIQNHYSEEQIIQNIPESEILVLKESFVKLKPQIIAFKIKLYFEKTFQRLISMKQKKLKTLHPVNCPAKQTLCILLMGTPNGFVPTRKLRPTNRISFLDHLKRIQINSSVRWNILSNVRFVNLDFQNYLISEIII